MLETEKNKASVDQIGSRHDGYEKEQTQFVADVLGVIHKGQEYLWNLRRPNFTWQLPAYLGPVYLCQFYLVSQWVGLKTKFDEGRFRKHILNRQLKDGSWYQIKDINALDGEMNVTILMYWTLKALGEPIDSEPMKNARKYIMSHGGIENAEIFLVAILALFGVVEWDRVPATPYLTFLEKLPMNYTSFSHWAKPHMLPFAYLRKVRAVRELGDRFSLDELKAEGSKKVKVPKQKVSAIVDGWLVKKLLSKQGKHGSWNGYSTSTTFSLAVLSHFSQHCSLFSADIEKAMTRGLEHLETLYLNEKNGEYLGVTCDGTNWETILTSTALLESGFKPSEISQSLEYVASQQVANGGMPYGMDFDTDPDVDDTSAAVILWSLSDKYSNNALRAIEWLKGQQCWDGGFGAFNRDNSNNPVLKFFLKNYDEVESLFDYSSADCAGHTLEALASYGFNKSNSECAKNAVEYLRQAQTKKGSWQGRWALNHIFGTYVALTGLIATGVDPKRKYIQNGLNWFFDKQNPDGGFGETTKSYEDKDLEGVGQSTPSQTAWAMLALIAGGLVEHPSVSRAAQYLVNVFSKHGKWSDPSVTATGHPGQAYMHYSVYAPCFPLIALSKYLKAKGIKFDRVSLDVSVKPTYEGVPASVTDDCRL